MASALQYIHHGVRPKDECPIVYPSNDRDDVVVARLLANKWPVLVHRDIKPANILLRKSRNLYTTEVNGKQIQYRPYPDVVLADFGLSFMKHDHDFRRETMAGTPTWFAPEAPKHTALGDIWMLGGVILAMARLSRNGPVRCAPDQKESAQWYRSEECRKGTDKPVVHPPYTEDLQYFLHKCLHRFKHQRPYAFRLFKQVEEASNFLQNDDKLEHPPALKSWALPG
jgi:serine/threonine protein kinase